MIVLILMVCVLYFVQLMLPIFLSRSERSAAGNRAARAAHNLRESLPVFFVLAVLSEIGDVESNLVWAQGWLLTRVAFLFVYTLGINLKPVDEFGRQAQPLRSLLWLISIVCLVGMAFNIGVS